MCDAMRGFNVRRLSARSNQGSKERALQGEGVVIVMCECAPIILPSICLTRGREPFGGLACVATQGSSVLLGWVPKLSSERIQHG